MYSVCFAKHILECGVTVLHVLEEPLLGELLEVVGVGLITCEEVGVVKRVHTFSSGVHRLATASQGTGRSARGSAGDKG